MTVDCKSESYRLYERGQFGNKLRTWNCPKAWSESDYTGRVVLRHKAGNGGKKLPFYGEHRTRAQALSCIFWWISAFSVRSEDIAINEAAPDSDLLVQGEAMLTTQHLSVFWSREKTQMRKALQNGQHSEGYSAISLLRKYLTAGSYDDIQLLFDRFPDSVIEFSAYRYCVGDTPGRNAVIWEVRNY